jgi:hypothetical protein
MINPLTRRGLFGLGATILGGWLGQRALGNTPVEPSPAKLTPATSCFEMQRCYVAGFRYHRGPGILSQMEIGEPLTLVAEPENEYDARAVRIEHAGRKIGYIPRHRNHTIARLLAQQARLSAQVVRIDEDAADSEKIEIAVYVDATLDAQPSARAARGCAVP